MTHLLEVLVVWLVASPVVGVAVGLFIARAGQLSHERDLPDDLVPDAVPADTVDGAVLDDVVATVARSTPERVATLVGTEGAIPEQARSVDDVVHLRLARPEA